MAVNAAAMVIMAMLVRFLAASGGPVPVLLASGGVTLVVGFLFVTLQHLVGDEAEPD